jgi:hypothetical protein
MGYSVFLWPFFLLAEVIPNTIPNILGKKGRRPTQPPPPHTRDEHVLFPVCPIDASIETPPCIGPTLADKETYPAYV